MNDEQLGRYAERVLALREERNSRLTQDELESIARDVGISIADLRTEVSAHLERASGYLSESLFDDAIRELDEAEVLAPRRADLLAMLSRAYFERWKADGELEDKAAARRHARAALGEEPEHEEARELLGALERDRGAEVRHGSGSVILVGIVVATAALIVVGGVVGWLVLGTRRAEPDVVESVGSEFEPFTEADPTGGTPGTFDLELDITGPGSGEVALSVRNSKLSVYPDSSFYALQGVLKNTGDREISRIDAALELLDEEGNVLHRDDPSLLSTREPSLRPGDLTPINITERASPAVKRARLTIGNVEGTPGLLDYPPSRAIDPVFGGAFSEHLELEVRERRAMFLPGASETGSYEVVFELENRGDRPIQELKLQLDLYDADDELIATRSGIVSYSMTPAIYPGEVWLENFITEIDRQAERYELTVTALD